VTKLEQLEDYKFKIVFDEEKLPDLIVDEIEPIGDTAGPNPPRLLSAVIGHCLSSSLIYCLSKARVKINGIQTIVKANIKRNEDGYRRFKKIDVKINLNVAENEKGRIARCLELFENYCTVTQSVRQGIEVNVRVA
jgi:uncharacterized OsmC-like protein